MAEFDNGLDVYREEVADLLEAAETGLLALKEGTHESCHVDEVFRAIHTVKGSSGLFDFSSVVAFAHIFENVLGDVREGITPLDDALLDLFLACIPQLERQVMLALDKGTDEELAHIERDVALSCTALEAYSTDRGSEVVEQAGLFMTADEEGVDGSWHISMQFEAGVLRDGMDPIGFIRYLGTLGDVVNVIVVDDTLHAAEIFCPLDCYLAFEVELRSDAERQTLENVFEFVREACTIRLVAPGSQIDEYIQLIESLPAGHSDRLGDILVASGALTATELRKALSEQNAASNGTKQPLLGAIVSENQGVAQPVVQAALEKQSRDRGIERKSVRVPIESLESLINLVGELVISSAGASLQARRFADPALDHSVTNVSKLIESVRDVAMSLRMVEIGQTFNGLRRAVRQLGAQAGKEIQLTLQGCEAELDKTIVEKIRDPLTHLVRNAADHGIEPPDDRHGLGKPRSGTIRLSAAHESGFIVIEVEDDGRGLDKEKIRAKAIERGLISAEQTLEDQEIYDLIFSAGFSTAEKVTDISGRGVGMDVVKRNIDALRGHIKIDSQLGRGTLLTIRLPLTLAIVDGFLVRVGASFYVLPLELVVECIESGRQERIEGSECIRARGRIMPYMPLADLFDDHGPRSPRQDVVVVQFAGQMAGLMVDELLGEYQTVVKPLGRLFDEQPCFTGATILATGEVAMLLDAPALVEQAIQRSESRSHDSTREDNHTMAH